MPEFDLLAFIFLLCLLYLIIIMRQTCKSIIIIIFNLSHMLESSTPDGLAPIGTVALIAFTCAIGGLSMIWGAANLFMLLRFIPEGQNSQKMQRVFELNRKLLRGALDITKFNLIVGLLATLIFFLIIMGAVQHFQSFYYSLAFLFGAINSIIIAIISVVVSCLATPRIINFARFSLSDAFDSAKKAANFQSFFFIGQTILMLGLFLVIYQRKYDIKLKDPQQLQRIAKSLVCFSFGSATIAIGTRIINSIYAKGADFAMESLNLIKDRLRKDHKHPALIAKALGQLVNKSLCAVLDSTTYLSAGVSITIYAATYNIIGADQKGQIVFQFSISNCYLPILSFLFSLFYNLLFNAIFSFVIRPSTGEGVRTSLNLQRYATFLLLCGFQALAAYLCLPAQFFVNEIGNFLRQPYHAYLTILFGLLLSTLVTTVAQIYSTHPFFINSLSNSCKTGTATNIIYGLSCGYFFNVVQIIFTAGCIFLADYWIGAYGVGLVGVGYLSLLPHYLFAQTTYCYLQNAGFISYISQLDESVTHSLVDAAKTRKDYEPHLSSLLYGFICCLGFQMILVFIESAHFDGTTSLKAPIIFLGLLIGAMCPYFYNACLLRSIYKSGPAISYDLNMQIQQIPGMANGNMDPDFQRTSGLFLFQCVLSLKRFVPTLIGPIVLLGITGGPPLIIGFLCGAVISGIQIGISSGMSGCAWSTIKKQIGFGNVRDEDGNIIKADSEWGRASDVGNSVGQNLKDCSSPSIPIMIAFWGLQSFAFASIYKSIHP